MDLDWEFQYPSNHESLLSYLAVELDFLCAVCGNIDEDETFASNGPKVVQRIYHLACVLWQSLEAYDLTDLLQDQLYDVLLQWTLNAVPNTDGNYDPVKLAIDRVLCSICAIKPHFYDKLLNKFGIPRTNSDSLEPVGVRDLASVDLPGVSSLESITLTENMLKSLGVISLSFVSTLIDLQILSTLTNSVIDFTRKSQSWQRDKRVNFIMSDWLDGEIVRGPKSGVEPTIPSSSNSPELPKIDINLVSAILDFFAELCWQNVMRMWLSSEERTSLWHCLFRYLCFQAPRSNTNCGYMLTDKPTVEQMRKLEEAYINLLSKCGCGCPKIRENFTRIFYDVLKDEVKQGHAMLGTSRFVRRILLDFIFSPGYIYVSVETDLSVGINRIQAVDLWSLMPPPAFPSSKRQQLLYVNMDRTCDDILKAITAKQSEEPQDLDPLDEVEPNIYAPSTSKLSNAKEDSPSPRKRSKKVEECSSQLTKKSKSCNLIENDEKLYKLMLWEPKTSRYVQIDRYRAVTEIFQEFFPNEEELEVPVLKFLLLNNEKKDEETSSKPLRILPTRGIELSVELHGFDCLALHVETKCPNVLHDYTWSCISTSSLLAFSFLLRIPEYRNNVHVHSVIQSMLGLKDRTQPLAVRRIGIMDEIRHLFNDQNQELRNPLRLLPFECLRFCIFTNYNNTTAVTENIMSTDVLNFILIFLSAYANEPLEIDSMIIQEHKTWMRAIQQCCPSRMKSHRFVVESQTYWPKGTGYSSGRSHGGNQTASRQDDEEFITELLLVLATYMNPHPELHSSSYMMYKEEICNMGFRHSLSPLAVRLIKKSRLLSIIFNYLENFSVFEVIKHVPLYKTVMLLLRIMTTNVQLIEMIIFPYQKSPETPGTSDCESQSIVTVMELMKKEINEYLQIKSQKDVRAFSSDYLNEDNIRSRQRKYKGYDSSEKGVFRDICDTLDIIEAVTSNLPTIRFPEPKSTVPILNPETQSSSDAQASKPTNPSEKVESKPSEEDEYVRVMKKLQFDQYQMISEEDPLKVNVPYSFTMSLSKSMVTIPSRMKRLAREMSNLATSLPISKESAIFVRHDENRIDVLKALITGPAGTPYMNGCFEFDIFCPDNYPSSPISVKFLTTGRGSVRFNPNLYACGKVCLSVLNTWQGGAGEDWNPQSSTILQVLVSIQGMILISEPYFNEPGYETTQGTNQGNLSSKAYSDKLLPATIRHAMINQMSSPSPCFEEVIKTHFWLKKDEIKEQVSKWIEESSGEVKRKLMNGTLLKRLKRESDGISDSFQILCLQDESKSLFTQLDKLTPPQD